VTGSVPDTSPPDARATMVEQLGIRGALAVCVGLPGLFSLPVVMDILSRRNLRLRISEEASHRCKGGEPQVLAYSTAKGRGSAGLCRY